MSDCCCICIDKLEEASYNLKECRSEHSKSFLISILEGIVGRNNFDCRNACKFDICVKCYGLLNNVDQFNIRLLEVCNQLKYLIRRKNEKEQQSAIQIENSFEVSCEEYPDFQNDEDIGTSDIIYENNHINEKCDRKEELGELVSDNVNLEEKKLSPAVTKIYNCDCLQQFQSLNNFEKHLKTHNFKPFVCEICGQSYKQKSTFNIHMKIHSGTNPFICTFCHKSFTQKISLMRHLPLHTGDKPHQCDECGKRFIHHTSFKIHKLTHSGQKTYKCMSCGESFRSSSHLKRHSKIHTGEKKFECMVCGRKFAEKYNLVAHQKIHSSNKSTLVRKQTTDL